MSDHPQTSAQLPESINASIDAFVKTVEHQRPIERHDVRKLLELLINLGELKLPIPATFGDGTPIAAVLFCPFCSTQHVDSGEWAKRPHHKHECLRCGGIWRVEPFVVGVPALTFEPPSSAARDLANVALRIAGALKLLAAVQQFCPHRDLDHAVAVLMGTEPVPEAMPE